MGWTIRVDICSLSDSTAYLGNGGYVWDDIGGDGVSAPILVLTKNVFVSADALLPNQGIICDSSSKRRILRRMSMIYYSHPFQYYQKC